MKTNLKLIHKGTRELSAGIFDLHVFAYENFEVIMVFSIKNDMNVSPYIRVQLGCLLGSVFEDKECDCGQQIKSSLKMIAKHGNGALIYLPTFEGKGKGLINKFKLAEVISEKRIPPYQAAEQCGLIFDEDNLPFVKSILDYLEIDTSIVLMTNNTSKIFTLSGQGINISNIVNIDIDKKALNQNAIEEISEKEAKYSEDLLAYYKDTL